MDDSVLTTIAVTGFSIAFFHAAIPTHWLPFVLTARAQRWSRAKTLVITTFAATGHASFTALLGLLVAWVGIAVSDRLGIWFPRIAGGALILFGLFYLVRQLTGHSHTHLNWFRSGEHEHEHEHGHSQGHARTALSKSDLAAILSLLALLTFSPCEAFVPVYVSGVRYGWHGFALLTIILTIGTIAGMVAFTALALIGIEQVKLRSFEKYEAAVMGALLCAIGVLIIIFEK
jgi:nickel/cobalt transporter (NicO) family protein